MCVGVVDMLRAMSSSIRPILAKALIVIRINSVSHRVRGATIALLNRRGSIPSLLNMYGFYSQRGVLSGSMLELYVRNVFTHLIVSSTIPEVLSNSGIVELTINKAVILQLCKALYCALMYSCVVYSR